MNAAAEELALCRRIAAGERHLFAEIVDEYSALVAGVIAAQGVDSADVDDLAQQAFVNVYKGLHGFRGDARLSSWIYRIAANVARAHLKRQAQRPRHDSVDAAMEAGQQPVDERPADDTALLRQRTLRAAMQQLPEAQLVSLSLYYFEELSYEQISEAMRLNLNTIRTHIRRGKLRLAELLDESVLT